MSGSRAWLPRAPLGLASDEPDQVLRLQAFRAAHPEVIVGDGGFGTLQARIPEPNGEIVITRYRLVELLGRWLVAGSLDSHLGGARTLILPGRIGPATREPA